MRSECHPSDSFSESQVGGGLYVHIAYCRSKCIYCDFFSAGERIADWHAYVDALCSEFRFRIKELAWPLRTVYFGGGTPSLMPEAEFHRLCAFLRPHMKGVEEFTLEVNPDDVDEHMLDVWRKEGVNRLSIGIQTFDDDSLKAIGRSHDSRQALEAFRKAKMVFDNVSVDLMFGLPGQTLEKWERDLRIAIELQPEHISAYSLMYEEGTALTLLRDCGRLQEANDDLTEKMFRILIEELSGSGYDHYEISNFARPGFRSRHNSSYWLQKPYIGLGPSAHSYDGLRCRKANRSALREYLKFWTSGLSNSSIENDWLVEKECLGVEELKEEYVLTRLRMREGIPLRDFADRFGEQSFSRLLRSGKTLAERNLVCVTDTHISLTEKAILLSDSVILDLASNC